jgi:hypothetical protein
VAPCLCPAGVGASVLCSPLVAATSPRPAGWGSSIYWREQTRGQENTEQGAAPLAMRMTEFIGGGTAGWDTKILVVAAGAATDTAGSLQ